MPGPHLQDHTLVKIWESSWKTSTVRINLQGIDFHDKTS